MTVLLELKPEIEAALTDQAKAKGLPLDAYLREVIEGVAHAPSALARDAARFRAALDELAKMGESIPHVASSAFSRQHLSRT